MEIKSILTINYKWFVTPELFNCMLVDMVNIFLKGHQLPRTFSDGEIVLELQHVIT